MPDFKLKSPFRPSGDQAQAIDKLVLGLRDPSRKFLTLLGVTGSGKTFTMANCIERINKPTLVISHNKTLAAQLYFEFKEFFPENAVEYFVSYYDYYQPEAYIRRRIPILRRIRRSTTGWTVCGYLRQHRFFPARMSWWSLPSPAFTIWGVPGSTATICFFLR